MALDLSTLRRPANPQVVDPSTGRMREDWQLYFDQLTTRINASVGALSTDPAPSDAQYIVAATNSTLSAERVATNTATVEWDFATTGQAKASVPADAFGDVVGPASATDNAVALFDGTTGKLLKNSSVTIDGSGNIATTGTLATGNVTVDGNGSALVVRGTGNIGIELGRVDGSASMTFIDFHTGATVVDYDVRLIASGGTGASGGGTLNIAAGTLQLNGNNLRTVTPIQQGSLSNVAQLDLSLGSADMYEIDLINFAPATNGDEFSARFSQSGSFLSGASDYDWGYVQAGNAQADATSSYIQLFVTAGNGANQNITVTARIFRPSAAGFLKSMTWFGGGMRGAIPDESAGRGRLVANTNAIDGVRFFFSSAGAASGNIASGYYAIRSYSFT